MKYLIINLDPSIPLGSNSIVFNTTDLYVSLHFDFYSPRLIKIFKCLKIAEKDHRIFRCL